MNTIVVKMVVIGAAIALWALASRLGWLDPRLFPAPAEVWETMAGMLAKSEIRSALATSMTSVVLTLLLSVPSGILLGALIASSRYWKEVLEPILFFPLSVPKSIFLPLFILAAGIGVVQKVSFGVFSVVFLIVTFTMSAIESVDPAHLRVAKSVGASRMQTLARVYIPSMLPTLLEGLRLSVIFAVTAVLLAEMYASNAGFGSLISSWGESFQVRQLVASVVVVSIGSIIVNEFIRWLEHQCEHWRNS